PHGSRPAQRKTIMAPPQYPLIGQLMAGPPLQSRALMPPARNVWELIDPVGATRGSASSFCSEQASRGTRAGQPANGASKRGTDREELPLGVILAGFNLHAVLEMYGDLWFKPVPFHGSLAGFGARRRHRHQRLIPPGGPRRREAAGV